MACLHLAGTARIDHLSAAGQHVSVRLKQRSGSVEYRFPALGTDGDGFSATCDLNVVDAGDALPPGTWDVWLDVTNRDVTRHARLGAHRDRASLPDKMGSAVGVAPRSRIAVTYYTASHGNLSILSGAEQDFALEVAEVHWADAAAGLLELSCALPDWGMAPARLRLSLLDGYGP